MWGHQTLPFILSSLHHILWFLYPQTPHPHVLRWTWSSVCFIWHLLVLDRKVASDPKSGRGMVGNAPNTLFFKYQCADSSAIGILLKWRFWFSGFELALVILHFWWAFMWCQGSWSANHILSSNTWRFQSKGKILKEGPTSNSNCGDIHFRLSWACRGDYALC